MVKISSLYLSVLQRSDNIKDRIWREPTLPVSQACILGQLQRLSLAKGISMYYSLNACFRLEGIVRWFYDPVGHRTSDRTVCVLLVSSGSH